MTRPARRELSRIRRASPYLHHLLSLFVAHSSAPVRHVASVNAARLRRARERRRGRTRAATAHSRRRGTPHRIRAAIRAQDSSRYAPAPADERRVAAHGEHSLDTHLSCCGESRTYRVEADLPRRTRAWMCRRGPDRDRRGRDTGGVRSTRRSLAGRRPGRASADHGVGHRRRRTASCAASHAGISMPGMGLAM